jgi:hypothetical protein
MAHYARFHDGVVTDIIVCDEDYIDEYAANDGTTAVYIQTSYNTRHGVHYEANSHTPSADQSKALRYNYASIGGTYDEEADAFIPPKPYDSWILNTEIYDWEPPVAQPDVEHDEDGIALHAWQWDEDSQSWINTLA